MKVGHFISSIDLSSGGPARSVTHLIKSMINLKNNLSIDLITSMSKKPILKKFDSNRAKIFFLEKINFGRLNLTKDVDAELYHGHGIWELPIHQMSKKARKKKIPYIITIRGMLEPWSLTQGKLKKKIALKLFQKKDLDRASCLHATAPMEVSNIRKLGFKNPIAMIPNGVEIDNFPSLYPEKKQTIKKILFLSRIHVKKGIEYLIDAWYLLDKELRDSWEIEIIGNGEEEYIDKLKKKIIELNLNDNIKIKQPVFGIEKIELFREANLFVLPSFSENFGIVIAEALASYTPVITTKGTPWEDLNIYNCGWWIDFGLESLKETLEIALAIENDKMRQMGENGRQLIEQKYSMTSVGKQMIELYNWIILKKDKPEFVDVL